MTQGDEELLRREAAAWFARMRGPGAEAARAAFDDWRGEAARQQAYDRLVRRFEDSAILGHSRLANLRLQPTARRRAGPGPWWPTAIAAGLALTAFAVWRGGLLPITPAPGRVEQFAAAPGRIETVRIAPGVVAVLDAGAALDADTSSGKPRLTLQSGRARIEAAGPVEIRAGRIRLSAQHGAFDLELGAHRDLDLSALRGELVVRSDGGFLATRSTRLTPGQRLRLGQGQDGRVLTAAARDRDWPTGLLIFDETPLDQVLAEANRYGSRRIRLAQPELGALRVTGGLRVTEPDALAQALAAALNLTVTRTGGGDLMLRRSAA